MAVKTYSVWIVFLILLFVFSSSLEAETFKWVDDSGIVHYSDQPLKSEDSEWVDDEEETYFTYNPSKDSESDKTPVSFSGNAKPNTSPQPKKYRPGLVQAPAGRTYQPPPQQSSSEGSYTRQNSTSRSSGTRSSGTRTSGGRY